MLRILFSLLLISAAFPAEAAQFKKTGGGLGYSEWLPRGGGKAPLILFSHGYGGCSTQSEFITQALADAGYAVVAPNHDDAKCDKKRGGGLGGGSLGGGGGEKGGRLLGILQKIRERRQGGGETSFGDDDESQNSMTASFMNSGAWDENTYRNRRDDMEALLNHLRSREPYRSRLDFSRMALMGHSLGGYTVLAMGGAWPSWKDSRFRAILALSPYSKPFIEQRTLDGITAPVMYQGGTRDLGITPGLRRSGGAYDQTLAAKYYVEFQGAGHFSWTNVRPSNEESKVAYSRAFFDRYLLGRRSELLSGSALSDVSDYRTSER